MKVAEKDSDRQATVHLHQEGELNELQEYHQYVDESDKALCCYVPVESGKVIKLHGRFSGETSTIAYEVAVDGVFRKAYTYALKSFSVQKSKKLDCDTFLVQTPEGVLDAGMWVAALPPAVAITKGDGRETLGTIEIRIHVLREKNGLERPVEDLHTYEKQTGDLPDNIGQATYTRVKPEFMMAFEKECPTLDKTKANRMKRTFEGFRPGKETWAIFRFHYRSKESIEEAGLEVSHVRGSKKEKAHILNLPPPPKVTSAEPDNAETSTRASSPTVTPTPTPITGRRETVPGSKPETPSKKQRPTITTPTPTATEETADTPDRSPSPDLRRKSSEALDESLRSKVFSAKFPKPLQKRTMDNAASPATLNGVPTNVAIAVKIPAKAPEKQKEQATTPKATGTANGASEQTVNKRPEESAATDMATKAGAIGKTTTNGKITVGHTKDSITDGRAADETSKHVVRIKEGTEATKEDTVRAIPNAKEKAREPPKSATSPTEKPTAVYTKAPVAQTKPTTPAKRPAELSTPKPIETKRAKLYPTPHPSPASPVPSLGSPAPKTPSIAEKRKQLAEARKQREQIAKKRAKINEDLAPYQQRMREEMERLERELEDEQRAIAEEKEMMEEEQAMLAEFNGVGGAE